jgi:hypothetical protein
VSTKTTPKPSNNQHKDTESTPLDTFETMAQRVPLDPSHTTQIPTDIDLNTMRRSQHFDGLGGTRITSYVGLRKPGPEEYFRVNTSPEWCIVADLYKDREGQVFFVLPAFQPILQTRLRPYWLHTVQNLDGETFLWPRPLPQDGVRPSPVHQTLEAAAQRADTHWTRLEWNHRIRQYNLFVAEALHDEPEWPSTLSFSAFVNLAFVNFKVDAIDHPAIIRLRGGR